MWWYVIQIAVFVGVVYLSNDYMLENPGSGGAVAFWAFVFAWLATKAIALLLRFFTWLRLRIDEYADSRKGLRVGRREAGDAAHFLDTVRSGE